MTNRALVWSIAALAAMLAAVLVALVAIGQMFTLGRLPDLWLALMATLLPFVAAVCVHRARAADRRRLRVPPAPSGEPVPSKRDRAWLVATFLAALATLLSTAVVVGTAPGNLGAWVVPGGLAFLAAGCWFGFDVRPRR